MCIRPPVELPGRVCRKAGRTRNRFQNGAERPARRPDMPGVNGVSSASCAGRPEVPTGAGNPKIGVQTALERPIPDGGALRTPSFGTGFGAFRNHLDADFGRFPAPAGISGSKWSDYQLAWPSPKPGEIEPGFRSDHAGRQCGHLEREVPAGSRTRPKSNSSRLYNGRNQSQRMGCDAPHQPLGAVWTPILSDFQLRPGPPVPNSQTHRLAVLGICVHEMVMQWP